jgi:hypothetical protein
LRISLAFGGSLKYLAKYSTLTCAGRVVEDLAAVLLTPLVTPVEIEAEAEAEDPCCIRVSRLLMTVEKRTVSALWPFN